MRNTALMFLALGVASILAACANSSPKLDAAAQVARGEAIFIRNCQRCHGDAATGAGRAPVAPLHSDAGHTWNHADGQIIEIVLGRANQPGRMMPSFAGLLTKADVLNIIAYLRSNWPQDKQDIQAEASRNWEDMKRNGG